MVLAETVTAIPAFGGGPLRYSAGLAVGRLVNRIAVLVGIAAMLDQLGFIREIATCLRRFGVGRWAGEGGEQQQDGAVHGGNFRAMANHDIQVLSCANFDSAFHLYATGKPGVSNAQHVVPYSFAS